MGEGHSKVPENLQYLVNFVKLMNKKLRMLNCLLQSFRNKPQSFKND